MAIWVIRSRTIAHHLSKKMGLLGVLNLSSWSSTTSSFQSSSSTMPHAFFGDSATHFPVPRFKSTEAERELDTKYINQGGGDQVFLICCFCFPGFLCWCVRLWDTINLALINIICDWWKLFIILQRFSYIRLVKIIHLVPNSTSSLKRIFFFWKKKKRKRKRKHA